MKTKNKIKVINTVILLECMILMLLTTYTMKTRDIDIASETLLFITPALESFQKSDVDLESAKYAPVGERDKRIRDKRIRDKRKTPVVKNTVTQYKMGVDNRKQESLFSKHITALSFTSQKFGSGVYGGLQVSIPLLVQFSHTLGGNSSEIFAKRGSIGGDERGGASSFGSLAIGGGSTIGGEYALKPFAINGSAGGEDGFDEGATTDDPHRYNDVPVGEGFLILMVFVMLYAIIKRRRV